MAVHYYFHHPYGLQFGIDHLGTNHVLVSAAHGDLQGFMQHLQATAAAGGMAASAQALAARGSLGRTALVLAAAAGHDDFVLELLVQHAVDFNAADDRGLTAMHYAAAAWQW